MITDHGRNVQSQVLRVHLRCESVRDTLLFTRADLHTITDGSQVSDEARSCWVEIGGPKTTTGKVDCDRLGFVVAEGQNSLRWLSIDQLDAEYLSSREVDINRYC